MKRAKGYCRYSTDNQTENSIAYQMAGIEKYCQQNDINLCGFFIDEGLSGTNTDRTGFQNLLSSANRGEFEIIVIYDITRGSRDVADWFNFRKVMMRLDIQVISATQKLGDITNPNDFLTELISIGLGQHQVLDTRQKSIAGTTEKAKQGLFCGGTPPLGYDIRDGQYIINVDESKIVKTIFELYSKGNSYNYIVDELKAKNYRGKNGRPFGKNSLWSILTNERYIGVYTWNKEIRRVMRKWAGGKPNPNYVRIEGAIPPLITKDIWERVQKRMKSRKHATNKAKRQYLLSGLIECATCSAAYCGHCSINKRKDGSRRETRYYGCGERFRTHTCDSKNINADELETFVVQNLKVFLLDIDFSEYAERFADAVNSASPDVSKEKIELLEISRKIDNGIKAVLSGMDIPELKNEIDSLRTRKSELEDIIAHKSNSNSPLNPNDIIDTFKWAIENWDDEHMERIVNIFISKIYVQKDGAATVLIGVHNNNCTPPAPIIMMVMRFPRNCHFFMHYFNPRDYFNKIM